MQGNRHDLLQQQQQMQMQQQPMQQQQMQMQQQLPMEQLQYSVNAESERSFGGAPMISSSDGSSQHSCEGKDAQRNQRQEQQIQQN